MQNVSKVAGGWMLNIAVNKLFTTDGRGYWSTVAKSVFVESITMFVSEGNEDGFFDGDLKVNFTSNTWDVHHDGLIYTDQTFAKCVRNELTEAGISNDIAEDVTYSEQGMQDVLYVSMDAYDLCDYVREQMQTK